MRVSNLLASGAFVSATLGLLGGCGGGGGDEPSFQNREPISLDAKQSAATTEEYATAADRYNAEREKALIAAGVRKPEHALIKKPEPKKETVVTAEPKKPPAAVQEPEVAAVQTQCKTEAASTGVTSDFCKSVSAILAPPKGPSSLSDFEDLQKQCAIGTAQLAPDAAARCRQNVDILQMLNPG